MAAKGSREQLAILLKRLGVKVCPEEYGLALTPEEFSTDSFTDPDGVADAIASQAREFIVWLQRLIRFSNPERIASTSSSYPSRFQTA